MPNTVALILLIIGIVLIIVELIVPGFGIPGICGFGSIVGAIFIYSTSIKQAMVLIGVAFIVLAILFVGSFLLFNKKSKFVLNADEKPEAGYVAARIDKSINGKTGIAVTDLHPSGTAQIDGQRISVQSMGEYIHSGNKIKVVDVSGCNIKVIRED